MGNPSLDFSSPELARVVTAWSKLPSPLKAAILAIIESSAKTIVCELDAHRLAHQNTTILGTDPFTASAIGLGTILTRRPRSGVETTT